MKTETQLTAELARAGNEVGALVLNLHPDRHSGSGWPDVYCAHMLYCGWIEFKGPLTKVRKNQKIILNKLKLLGDTVCIVRFLSEDRERLTVEIDEKRQVNLHGEGPIKVKRRKQFLSLMRELNRQFDL